MLLFTFSARHRYVCSPVTNFSASKRTFKLKGRASPQRSTYATLQYDSYDIIETTKAYQLWTFDTEQKLLFNSLELGLVADWGRHVSNSRDPLQAA